MPDWLLKLLCVAGAGSAGAVLRWGIHLGMQNWTGHLRFPWATLVINASGCLLFGLIVQILTNRAFPADHLWRLTLLTGFLGAYTTYSTFAFETVQLQTECGWFWALVNVGAQVLVGWLAVLVGLLAGRYVLP